MLAWQRSKAGHIPHCDVRAAKASGTPADALCQSPNADEMSVNRMASNLGRVGMKMASHLGRVGTEPLMREAGDWADRLNLTFISCASGVPGPAQRLWLGTGSCVVKSGLRPTTHQVHRVRC